MSQEGFAEKAGLHRTYIVFSLAVVGLAVAVVTLIVVYREDNNTPPFGPDQPDHLTDDTLRVVFSDVGQAGAILIQLGDVDVVIDTGTSGLGQAAPLVNEPIELMIISHPHSDHFGGGANVIRDQGVLRVITNGEDGGSAWDDFEDAVDVAGLAFEFVQVGDVLEPADDLTLTFLATGSPQGGQFPDSGNGSDVNNDSLVLRLDFAGRSILFTGDIEADGQLLLMDRYCGSSDCSLLEVDVLKVPHHGSDAFLDGFFEATLADWAVISADYDNAQHHHPRADTIEALQDTGMEVLSTSTERTWNVVLTIDEGGNMAWDVPDERVFYWDNEGGEWIWCLLD